MGFSSRLLRPAILRIAGHQWTQHLATRSRIGRSVATRFVAGETLPDALAVARELAQIGVTAGLNHLGENAESPSQALESREAYLAEVAAGQAVELDMIVSIKLTQLGLDESVDACWANVEPIVAAAEPSGMVVMIDMESYAYVDETLDVLHRAVARSPRVGVAIQSYLRRSTEDVFALPAGCRVRLVKGAYLERREVVFRSMRDVDGAYRRLFATLLERGHAIDVATHDPDLIDGVRGRVDATPDGWSRVEFQMLYGVRPDLQRSLAAQGYPVRVYIPYGTDWYPYLTRRLAERPANVWFFLSNLMRTR